jgi:hypothetical protein
MVHPHPTESNKGFAWFPATTNPPEFGFLTRASLSVADREYEIAG